MLLGFGCSPENAVIDLRVHIPLNTKTPTPASTETFISILNIQISFLIGYVLI